MKRKLFNVVGVLAVLLSLMVLGGCKTDSDDDKSSSGSSGGISGRWGGTVGYNQATVIVTSTGWTLSVPGVNYSDSGTYSMDGVTATLYSNGKNVGTAVLIDSNTISLTLNQNSVAPGIYALTRR